MAVFQLGREVILGMYTLYRVGGGGALALLAGWQVQAVGCGGLPCGQVGHVHPLQGGSALALLAGWHLGDCVLPALGYISGG